MRARSSAFDIAAESARAGAQELDQDALADGRIVVDPSAAHERIAAYLAAHDVNGDITITAETVTVTNLTSCSYRGPYVETAHVHGNNTLSIQMFTLSAITQDSVQDYKFNLTCDGVNATLSNT